MSDYQHHTMFPLGPDKTPYRKLTGDYVSVSSVGGREIITVDPEAIKLLTFEAFKDVSHLLRPAHLQ